MQILTQANTPQEITQILEQLKTDARSAVNLQIVIVYNSMINSINNSSNANLNIGGINNK